MSAFVELPVTELSGAALDWAVAKAIGLPIFVHTVAEQMAELQPDIFTDFEKERLWQIKKPRLRISEGPKYSITCPSYSTEWSQGAPLAEKYDISTILMGFPKQWHALIDVAFDAGNNIYGLWEATGDTLLIAICRVLVAAKLGAIVNIPAELVTAAQT